LRSIDPNHGGSRLVFCDRWLHRPRCKYDADVRTTVDLPPAVHRRATELAKQSGKSLSSVVAELATYGLSRLDEPLVVSTDPRSGFPVVSLGHRVTSQEVADALDDE
jgi:hypothetical protein